MSEFFLFAEFERYERGLAGAMLFFAMLGMGATLKATDFLAVFRLPRSFATGMLLQLCAVPLIAYLVIALAAFLIGRLAVPLGLAGCGVGLALVAAMPGGSASNIFTFLGRGNAPLSVALTACATASCLITTPIVFAAIAPAVPGGLQMPHAVVVREIGSFLLLPLAVGMAVHRLAPVASVPFAKWNIRISLSLVATLVVGSAGAGRLDLDTFGVEGVLLVIGFAVAIQQLALWTTVALGLPPADRLAILVELTIRNTLLALLLLANLPAGTELDEVKAGAFFVILFYGAVGMAVALPPLLHYRRRAERAQR